VTSLAEYTVVGLDDFLQREEKFIKSLQPKDQKAIDKNLSKWVEMPHYPSLCTGKMANAEDGDCAVWESRMTQKIRLRFLVNEHDKQRMPIQLDLHTDRNNDVSRALAKGINHYSGLMMNIIVAFTGLGWLVTKLFRRRGPENSSILRT
jgi:hypothetical protein